MTMLSEYELVEMAAIGLNYAVWKKMVSQRCMSWLILLGK